VGQVYLLLKFRKEAHFRIIINVHNDERLYISLTRRLLTDFDDLFSHLDDTPPDITLVDSQVPLEGRCINLDGSIKKGHQVRDLWIDQPANLEYEIPEDSRFDLHAQMFLLCFEEFEDV
jgi:hypothetical protein